MTPILAGAITVERAMNLQSTTEVCRRQNSILGMIWYAA